ncbi:glycerophosphodiester phosphodiesterase, partial [bacterium]|nr:glycerophosphodiester phosphodiesterase [bacterium]
MKNTVIVAHRGFSGIYPENTLLSFKKAEELGADAIELDVRETEDGEIIVIHDEKVDRTTDGTGFVRELKWEDIKKLDAGKWKGNFENVKIPLLREVFDCVSEKIKILIEIKEADVEKVIEIIKEKKREKGVIIGSFNLEYLIEIRKVASEIPLCFITFSFPQSLETLIKNGIQMVSINHTHLDSSKFKKLLLCGFGVIVWTVDEEKDMKRMLEEGIN